MENQNAAKKRKNKLGTRRKGFIIAFLAPTLIAFCVFYLYPIITVFITSFCKWDYTNITSPEFFGWSNLWDNYDYIFNKYPFFWEALKNSTTWAILGTVVQIPIAALIALALSRKVKGIKFVRNVYIIPNMISTLWALYFYNCTTLLMELSTRSFVFSTKNSGIISYF